MNLNWSAFAIADREAIFGYIKADSPRAAVEIDKRIQDAIEVLIDFPEIGRLGRVEATRELVIQRTPYIAAYQIKANAITILRILHGAQQWPEEINP
jgi:addiction module RelE/StbE family toxin